MPADPDLLDDLELLAEAMFGGCQGGHDTDCECRSDDDLRCCLEATLTGRAERCIHVHEGWVTLEYEDLSRVNGQDVERRTLCTPGVRGLVTTTARQVAAPRRRAAA